MVGLTDKQEETMKYLREYINEKFYPPSVREIGKRFGISTKAAFDRLLAMEIKGVIKRTAGIARGIQILK